MTAVFGQTTALDVAQPKVTRASLFDKFQVPPFSVLDTRQGYWQDLRRSWLSLGIKSELGRGQEDRTINVEEWDMYRDAEKAATRRDADERSNLTGASDLPEYADFGMAKVAPGTSIFDPVLCDLAYRWWCPPGGTVLDPFAGGSVRGIVAGFMGHPYVGIDLAADQIAANEAQANEIIGVAGQMALPGVPEDHVRPTWIVGDSREVLPTLTVEADFVFSCPPYYDLEVYGDDPRDLSRAADWDAFTAMYRDIIAKAVARLRPGHFACFVVSEIRGPNGHYRGLVPETIWAFELAGAALYNEAILVNPAGTLPLRVTKQFEKSRKLGRTHQNVLVFVKGASPRTDDWDYARTSAPPPQVTLWEP